MSGASQIELGLTIPLQRHLHVKAPPRGREPDRRFCWDLHVIPLRGRSSLLAVHCHSRYAFVLYDLSHSDWTRLPEVFRRFSGKVWRAACPAPAFRLRRKACCAAPVSRCSPRPTAAGRWRFSTGPGTM